MSATGGLTLPVEGITRSTNAKARPLTREELEAERAAQNNVKKYLEERKEKGLPIVDTTSNESAAAPKPLVVNMDPSSVSMIDKLLSKSGLSGGASKSSPPRPAASSAAQQASLSIPTPQQRMSVPPPVPAATVSEPPRVQAVSQPVPPRPTTPPPQAPAVGTGTKIGPPPPRPTAPSTSAATNKGAPLSSDDEQLIKEATSWLIKHR